MGHRIRLLRHDTNRGPGSGILTGIANARGILITFIPADLAITLDQFPKYLEAAKHADVVVGIRSDRSDYSFLRKINSHTYIWMVKILFGMRQRQFNYVHLYRREIFKQVDIWSQGVFITAEIMIRARDCGFRIKEVEIDYVPRISGKASCGRPAVIGKTFSDLMTFWRFWVMHRLDQLEPKFRAHSND
jgi:glycosyltransferase involved in cell wall biosynthesis